jgi:hypothetical protein
MVLIFVKWKSKVSCLLAAAQKMKVSFHCIIPSISLRCCLNYS